jgi:predicted ester cyclase
MTKEENRAIVKRYLEECWNKKNVSILSEFIAPDCAHYTNGRDMGHDKGPEGVRQMIEQWSKPFPDLHGIWDDEISEENKVAIRGTMTGTHNGELQFIGMTQTIPPTGKRIKLDFVNIVHMANGKIIGNWYTVDYSWIWWKFLQT